MTQSIEPKLKIAVLGTGSVGQAIAKAFISDNHNVKIGTRGVNETLAKDKPDGMGNLPISSFLKDYPKVNLETFANAVIEADIVVLAVGGKVVFEVLEQAGKIADGTIVLDVSNPLDFSKGFPPSLTTDSTLSLSEKIQTQYPTLKIVKSLNTMSNSIMLSPDVLKDQGNVFVCGNDEAARIKIKSIFEAFGWGRDTIIDLGDLSGARGMEMILPLWVRLFQSRGNANLNFKIVE